MRETGQLVSLRAFQLDFTGGDKPSPHVRYGELEPQTGRPQAGQPAAELTLAAQTK